MNIKISDCFLTSFMTGLFFICLARFPYFNVLKVSRKDFSEGEIQQIIIVSVFPPKASFINNVQILNEKDNPSKTSAYTFVVHLYAQ